MAGHSGHKTNTVLLSKMLDLTATTADLWQPEELAAILRHQLSAPLAVALGPLSAEVPQATRDLSPRDVPASLGDLLGHPKPPMALLELTKRFAKLCRTDAENVLPEAIAMLLYYASIVAAILRHGRRISDLDDEALRRGLKWGCGQTWIDATIGDLLREGLEHLDKHPARRNA